MRLYIKHLLLFYNLAEIWKLKPKIWVSDTKHTPQQQRFAASQSTALEYNCCYTFLQETEFAMLSVMWISLCVVMCDSPPWFIYTAMSLDYATECEALPSQSFHCRPARETLVSVTVVANYSVD